MITLPPAATKRAARAQLAAARGQSPYNVAVADYLSQPEVQRIELGDYRGQPGVEIAVIAVDDVKVKAVRVTITTDDGGLVEAADHGCHQRRLQRGCHDRGSRCDRPKPSHLGPLVFLGGPWLRRVKLVRLSPYGARLFARLAMTTPEPKTDMQSYEGRLDVHGPEASFNADGVDLSQIRESLALTPLELLYRVQNWVNSLAQIRVVRGPR